MAPSDRAVAAVMLAAAVAPAAAIASPPPGASACSGCHAAASGGDASVPPLAGIDAAELVRAMQAFRSGRRHATVMDRIARGFTDAEIEAIAAWYAAQR